MPSTDRSLRTQVLLAFAVGVALRVSFTVITKGTSPLTVDGPWYVGVARMLNQGDGMIFPTFHDRWGASFETAQHPPLFVIYMAGVLRLVGRNFLALRIGAGLLGAVGILVAAGLGREVGGKRLAVVLAWLVALSPLLWINDAEVHSESAHIPIVLAVLWAAYRLHQHPTIRAAAVLGAVLGLAVLNRTEAAMLCVVLALPVIADLVRCTFARRVQLLAVCAASVLVFVGPWFAFNLMRFDERVWFSTSGGGVFPMANCDPTYYGELAGYTSVQCWFNRDEMPLQADDLSAAAGLRADGEGFGIDPVHCRCDPDDWACISEVCLLGGEGAYGTYGVAKGLHYMHEHVDRVPYVVSLRVLRSLELYDPLQKAAWDVEHDSRNRLAGWMGLSWYYLSLPFALHGMVLMRRRGTTLLPVSAFFIVTTFAAAIASPVTRFRLGFDVAILLPVAVSVVAMLDRLEIVRARARPTQGEPSDVVEVGSPGVT